MTTVGTINFHCIIPCDDAGTTKDFYAAVFPEWNFRSQPPNEFWEITGANGVTPQTAFLAIMKGSGSPSTPTQYYTVDDLDIYVERAVQLGAMVVVPKSPVPGVGYYAELLDINGSPFGFWQADADLEGLSGPQHRS